MLIKGRSRFEDSASTFTSPFEKGPPAVFDCILYAQSEEILIL
jgi:hypothetical protein